MPTSSDLAFRGSVTLMDIPAAVVYRLFYRVPGRPEPTKWENQTMQGHVARKRDRYYAVIYEGLDPVTGKEKRSWHPAGTDRAEAEALAARLAAERDGRNDEIRSLTFGCPCRAADVR